MEFPCFLCDLVNVSNLICVSSAFSKPSLYLWKFLVYVLLKLNLKDFEHNLTSMWNEYTCGWYEHSLALPFFGIGMKTDLFLSCGHCWVFQICWHIDCSTLTESSFRMLNSSTGIPSLPLAFFVEVLLMAHLTSHSMMSSSRLVTTPSWLSGSLRSFLYNSSGCSCHLF